MLAFEIRINITRYERMYKTVLTVLEYGYYFSQLLLKLLLQF